MDLNTLFDLGLNKRITFPGNGLGVVISDQFDFITGSGLNDYLFLPDLYVGPTGTRHLVFRSGSGHNTDPANGFISYSRSTNTTGRPVFSTPITCVANPGYLISNPSVLETLTGRIIVYFTAYPQGGQTIREAYYVYSDDGGATFSSWTQGDPGLGRVTTEFIDPGQIDGSFGSLILSDNTILKGYYARPTGSGTRGCFMFRSTDNGITYELYQTIHDVSVFDFEECTFTRRQDGLITVFMRSDAQQYSYLKYFDGTNFFGLKQIFPSTGKNGLATSPNGTSICVGRNIADTGNARTIWAYSNDTFATLSDVNFLDENLGRYMYSNCGWDTHLNKFICVHSVETGEENIGPCKLVCTLFDEVEL